MLDHEGNNNQLPLLCEIVDGFTSFPGENFTYEILFSTALFPRKGLSLNTLPTLLPTTTLTPRST